MGWLRLFLLSGVILGAIIGVELAWVRHASPEMLALFSHDGNTAYHSLYIHHAQLGFVHIKDDIHIWGKSVDQQGLLYSPQMSTNVYEFRTDGTQRLLFEAPLEAVEFIGTSPDGEWYLFLNNLNLQEYYLVRTDGSEWHTLASPTNNIFTFWRWSHNGQWMFFENHETDGNTIYRVQTTSRELEKIAVGSYRGMSPDNQWLFLFAEGDFFRVRLDNLEYEALAHHDGYIDIVDIDERGAWVLYQAYNYDAQVFDIWYIDLQSRETKRILTNRADTFAIESNWATNELLVYTLPTFDGRFAIYTIRPDGSERELVVEKAHEKYVPWLNEDLILYSDGTDYYVKRISTGQKLRITAYDPNHSVYIRVKDDQQHLIVGKWRQRPFLEIDLATGQRRFLPKDPPNFVYLGDLQFIGRKWHPYGLGGGVLGVALGVLIIRHKKSPMY